MTRRRFLFSLPLLSLLPRLLSARSSPPLYLVQYHNSPAGRCNLFWDGQQHWRAEYVGRTRDYVHPHAWHGLDAEFYRMQQAAQDMMHDLVRERRSQAD